MTEHRTKGINDSQTCEEQVFGRFDRFHERFDRIEAILGNVEAKIGNLEVLRDEERVAWEHFLAAINDLAAKSA
jgi:hypothetical protein